MYLANTTMNRARNNYYGNNYTPHMYTNGKDSGSSPSAWKSDALNYLNDVGLYEISVNGSQSGNNIDFDIISSSISNISSSSDIRLYVATIIGHVKYPNSPNGLIDHYNAVVEILTGNSGKKMNYKSGVNVVNSFSWSMPKNWINHPLIKWNSKDIKIVAWIQNYNSKEILQVINYDFE